MNKNLLSLANQSFIKKDYNQARNHYLAFLEENGDDSEVYANLGVTYKVLGDMSKAIDCFEKSVKIDPKYSFGWLNLGTIWKLKQDFKKASYCYNMFIKIDPKNPEGYNSFGILFEKMGNTNRAIDAYKMAIKVSPKFVQGMNNLGVLLYKQKRYDDSVKVFEVAHKVDPEYIELLSNMGAALNKANRYDEAIKYLRKVIEKRPNHSGAYTNLGNVYNKLHEYKEASKLHEKSIKLDPNGSNAYSNVGTSYKNLGQAKKAITSYKKAIELNPNFENAHFDLATVYLSLKDFKNGWSEYEWRFRKDEMKSHLVKYKNIFSFPKLEKESKIKGKTLLLHTEQGYGDSIMFARFIDRVKEKFECNIVLQCRDELKSLFENSIKNVDIFYARDKEPVPLFDFQYSMLSLPFLLEINELKDIEVEKSYLVPKESEEINIPKEKGKIDIGICWSASVTGESYDGKVFDLEYFRPLIEHDKFNVYSLQVGPESSDLDKFGLRDKVIDITEKLSDFNKTACLMDQLDLVISSDTSVAHLAGAIGQEVWVPLQKIPDWRWENKGEKSYWYEKSTLFRQKTARNWDTVFQSIYAKLNKNLK